LDDDRSGGLFIVAITGIAITGIAIAVIPAAPELSGEKAAVLAAKDLPRDKSALAAGDRSRNKSALAAKDRPRDKPALATKDPSRDKPALAAKVLSWEKPALLAAKDPSALAAKVREAPRVRAPAATAVPAIPALCNGVRWIPNRQGEHYSEKRNAHEHDSLLYL
jgi:hypothetical protein